MGKIPKNLLLLHDGQLFLRNKSLKAIAKDKNLNRHVALIENCMDVLNMFSMSRPTRETKDTKVIRLLGMRLFNGCAVTFQLIVSGYYQNATMHLRDLVETVFLLGFFDHQPDKIAIWRTGGEKVSRQIFQPSAVRKELDKRDGFTGGRRKELYDLYCKLGAHPTNFGLQMLGPKGHDAHCGPFLDPGTMKAMIEDLTKLAVQAAAIYNTFFRPDTKQKIVIKLSFLEAAGEWSERYYGRPFDRKGIEDAKALLAQL